MPLSEQSNLEPLTAELCDLPEVIISMIFEYLSGNDRFSFYQALISTKPKPDERDQFNHARRGAKLWLESANIVYKAKSEFMALVRFAQLEQTQTFYTEAPSTSVRAQLLDKGDALAQGLQCWDWSTKPEHSEEMVDWLLREMLSADGGRAAAQAVFTRLYPSGVQAFVDLQKQAASDFVTDIIQPLANDLHLANTAAVEWIFKKCEALDESLLELEPQNSLLNTLNQHSEKLTTHLEQDLIYNPYTWIAAEQFLSNWQANQQQGASTQRLDLLAIRTLGGLLAASPNFVVMLMARNHHMKYSSCIIDSTFQLTRQTTCISGPNNGDLLSNALKPYLGRGFWAIGARKNRYDSKRDSHKFRSLEKYIDCKADALLKMESAVFAPVSRLANQ